MLELATIRISLSLQKERDVKRASGAKKAEDTTDCTHTCSTTQPFASHTSFSPSSPYSVKPTPVSPRRSKNSVCALDNVFISM